jgi:hypothetical protein
MYLFDYTLCAVTKSRAYPELTQGIKSLKFDENGNNIIMFAYDGTDEYIVIESGSSTQ